MTEKFNSTPSEGLPSLNRPILALAVTLLASCAHQTKTEVVQAIAPQSSKEILDQILQESLVHVIDIERTIQAYIDEGILVTTLSAAELAKQMQSDSEFITRMHNPENPEEIGMPLEILEGLGFGFTVEGLSSQISDHLPDMEDATPPANEISTSVDQILNLGSVFHPEYQTDVNQTFFPHLQSSRENFKFQMKDPACNLDPMAAVPNDPYAKIATYPSVVLDCARDKHNGFVRYVGEAFTRDPESGVLGIGFNIKL